MLWFTVATLLNMYNLEVNIKPNIELVYDKNDLENDTNKSEQQTISFIMAPIKFSVSFAKGTLHYTNDI